ncbi:MAG: YndJ family transporter [Planctomycetaceae bacterium]|jgi:hypothetical protein|nr:YndJ family transporter [Planctomycetaceae bacterium]MBT4726402.1 YndJ family transporter [Planctomycetaceae bacterium]MBT4846914.1 YndJ family transporter [Planctomycetaceae bacterium]MBT5597240.1 YndJ family transporter [Planctomycetaceae bacterium]MBT6846042.1 YndJ family transporter [Planctomycetaceae bacterium]
MITPLPLMILMLAILLVVPLGIHVSFRAELLTVNQRIRHITWRLWICCSLPAVIATSSMLLFYPVNKEALGYRAVSWIGGVSWFVFTLWMFVIGGTSLWHFITTLVKNRTTTQRIPWEHLPAAGGWLFIAVGGLWFTSLIVGKPLGVYDMEFTMLTALHFHFAGFALPVLTGQLIHFSTKNKRALINVLIITCPIMLVSIPAVGIGIACSPTIEVVASISLLTCCILMAVCQIYCAGFIKSHGGWLLSISATALIASSIMAVIYSTGEYTGNQSLSIPIMIVSHGALNSLGFSLLGLVGWTICQKKSK